MPKKTGNLEQLMVEELQDLYDAEKQLVRALPKVAKSASDEELQSALKEHLEVTKGQVRRLEQIFEQMDMRAKSRPCQGMKGIVEEGRHILSEDLKEGVLDSAIAGASRKVEHYEIAGYETARALAREMGMREAADLLQQTLQEEIQTEKRLGQISARLVKEARREDGRTGVEEGESASKRGPKDRSGGSRTAAGRSGSSAQASSRRSSSGRSGYRSRGESSGRTSRSAHMITGHEEIRQWAEERGGHPACVRGTGGEADIGMIRIDFPGFSGEQSLEEITWDEWFEKFDERNLGLLVQDMLPGSKGTKSNFNKIVSRQTAEDRTRAAH